MKTPNSSSRARRFSLVTYIQPEILSRFLADSSWVQHFAFITHDRDVWSAEDEQANPEHVAGSFKTAHTHVIVFTYDAKTPSAIIKSFDRVSVDAYGVDGKQNTTCEVLNDAHAHFRYFMHLDDPHKVRYSMQEITADDFAYWERMAVTDGLTDSSNNPGLAMVQSMIDGATYRQMVERYGKEFIYHQTHYENMVAKIKWEESDHSVRVNDELIDILLKASPFAPIDVLKFKEILKYLKDHFAVNICSDDPAECYFSSPSQGKENS